MEALLRSVQLSGIDCTFSYEHHDLTLPILIPKSIENPFIQSWNSVFRSIGRTSDKFIIIIIIGAVLGTMKEGSWVLGSEESFFAWKVGFWVFLDEDW